MPFWTRWDVQFSLNHENPEQRRASYLRKEMSCMPEGKNQSGNYSDEKNKTAKKPKTKKEKQWGMTPREGADDDNPAMWAQPKSGRPIMGVWPGLEIFETSLCILAE